MTQASISQDSFTARLAVGQEGQPTSGILRVWSPAKKSDIYAAMRGIAGECKISLHPSGECRAGLTEQFARKEADAVRAMGGSRHQSRWTRATHVGMRVVTPLQFVIPASELRPFSQNSLMDAQKGTITWIVPPKSGRSIIVSCLFSGQQVQDANWPGRPHQTHLAGSKLMPNGEKFWLIWQDFPTGDLERMMLAEARTHMVKTKMVTFSGNDPCSPPQRLLIFREFLDDRQLVVMDAAMPKTAPKENKMSDSLIAFQ